MFCLAVRLENSSKQNSGGTLRVISATPACQLSYMLGERPRHNKCDEKYRLCRKAQESVAHVVTHYKLCIRTWLDTTQPKVAGQY